MQTHTIPEIPGRKHQNEPQKGAPFPEEFGEHDKPSRQVQTAPGGGVSLSAHTHLPSTPTTHLTLAPRFYLPIQPLVPSFIYFPILFFNGVAINSVPFRALY